MTANASPLIIGCDHAAFQLKQKVVDFIKAHGIEVHDVGTFNEASVDYPDFGAQVALAVSNGRYSHGILICGTGIGMSIVANRYANVRAALCNDLFAAKLSRQHNDANVLVMGGRVIGDILAFEIVKTWLETPFEGGRHQKRIDLFNKMGQTA